MSCPILSGYGDDRHGCGDCGTSTVAVNVPPPEVIKKRFIILCYNSMQITPKNLVLALLVTAMAFRTGAQELRVKNDRIQRILKFDGKVWRTIKFLSADGRIALDVKSEEFHILPMGKDEGLSISDFLAAAPPRTYKKADTSLCEIRYKPASEALRNTACPKSLAITYYAVKGEPFIRKSIKLLYDQPATVDRLEVERFVNNDEQSGGGRGEPVFIRKQWFTGLEYPAGYSRRGDGNQPASYGRYYDSVGNYSYIDLEGRDVEPHAQQGMVRLMHFPGYAVRSGRGYAVVSKTAVTGYAAGGVDVREAFMQYLATIWKKPVSFLNYNNWFDSSAKDLKGDAFVKVYEKYKAILDPYGVSLDAMVPDAGWSDANSVYKPLPEFFPNGDQDLALLSRKLEQKGTHLGLWLAINDYDASIDSGIRQGYHEAGRNRYFSQYARYYSLSATKYRDEVLRRLPQLAKTADIAYFKHDFNNLCDLGEGNNHPPTDRHGHEANLDVELRVLTETRKARPGIVQNLTNWVWFSPWWLQYGDYLWMLAGDDGSNGNTPELSEKAMSTTDRDTYIWRMFGNPADRPLVPVSRLMTHGIQQISAQDRNVSLTDWTDFVVMHYGRGTLLKEWYISLDAMRPELWAALACVHKWAKQHEAQLDNVVMVGGRPDEGNVYGYIGWCHDSAVLTARNAGPLTQKLVIPFNAETGFYGAANERYQARVTYPYSGVYGGTFVSGKAIEVEVPGYSTMVLEFEKGDGGPAVARETTALHFDRVDSNAHTVTFRMPIPVGIKERSELLIIGHPGLPATAINDSVATPSRTSKARLNNFADYAISGMRSSKASDWTMAGYSLLPYAGKEITVTCTGDKAKFNIYLLTDRPVKDGTAEGDANLARVGNHAKRQVVQLN